MEVSLGIFKLHVKQHRHRNHSASACRISSKQDHPRQSDYVISIFQDGGHGIPFLLPVLSLSEKVKIQLHSAYQISARYLNPPLRYYYFRFLKTNVRYVGILLPVPIFTFALPSACHSASVYQILSKSDHRRQSYDVISTFKMAATVSQFYFRFRFSSLRSFGSRNLPAYQISARYLN